MRAGALGDTLMVTPLLRALQERRVAEAVDVLCARGAAPIVENHPAVDRTFTLTLRNLPYAISLEKRRLARALRGRDYASAILLERAPRYRVLLERAGIETIRSFRETPFDPESHAIVNNLRVAGFDERNVDLNMEAFWSPEETERAERLLSTLPRPRVGIHVGYGPRGKKGHQSERLKGWPLERFGDLAARLAKQGVGLVFTGSREDAADVARVVASLPPESRLDLAGKTSVRELAATIAGLDLFVSVDTGPAHLAAAVGTPLVVLWGPAILEQVRPVSTKAPVTVLCHPPPCAPCYDTPLMKTCRHNVCMEAISTDEVLARVLASIG